MSDPRFPLAPACPDDDGARLEPDLDYYRGCYEDMRSDFLFLLGVIRTARDMVRARGTTQIKTSELLDVLGRDDKDLLHGQPAEARGAVERMNNEWITPQRLIKSAEDSATVFEGRALPDDDEDHPNPTRGDER